MRFIDILNNFFKEPKVYRKFFEDYLREETTIGYNKNYKISIYPEPLGNPSFHIRYENGDNEQVFQIKDFKLLEPKRSKIAFSLKETKEWLKEESDNFPTLTNWQVLLKQWNLNNIKYQIPENLEIPE